MNLLKNNLLKSADSVFTIAQNYMKELKELIIAKVIFRNDFREKAKYLWSKQGYLVEPVVKIIEDTKKPPVISAFWLELTEYTLYFGFRFEGTDAKQNIEREIDFDETDLTEMLPIFDIENSHSRECHSNEFFLAEYNGEKIIIPSGIYDENNSADITLRVTTKEEIINAFLNERK